MSRLLIHLTMQTMLWHICYFAADTSLFFESHSATSVRLNHRYRIETKTELFLCLRYCLDDPRCLAINHNEMSRTCELNDKNCFFQNHTKEEESGWSIYNALKDCGDPGSIPNATLKFGDNTLTGSVANYTCDAGYRPDPNSTGNKISCGPDGVWSTIRFSCEGCPEGWTSHDDRCYLFETQLSNWMSAVDTCSGKGGYLVEINSEDENDYLKQQVLDLGLGTGTCFWVGGTDEDTEDDWTWFTSGTPITFMDWGKGEPNGFESANCLLMWHDQNYVWIDFGCSWLCYFICEMEI